MKFSFPAFIFNSLKKKERKAFPKYMKEKLCNGKHIRKTSTKRIITGLEKKKESTCLGRNLWDETREAHSSNMT